MVPRTPRPPDVDLAARFRSVSEGSGWIVGLSALALIATWSSDVLPSIGMAGPMSQKTLVCTLLAAASLVAFHRSARPFPGALLGAAAGLPGVLVLAGLIRIGGAGDGKDALERLVTQAHMALPTSVILMLLGFALVGLHLRWRPAIVEPPACGALALAMLAAFGHLYHAQELYAPLAVHGIALSAALSLGALATGVLAARPETGMAALYASQGPAGLAARALLAPVLLLPFSLGALSLAGTKLRLFDAATAVALVAVTTTGIFAVMLTSLARRLVWAQEELRAAQDDVVRAQRVDVASYMAGWIAHEFNNLMTVIHGNLELALDDPSLARDALQDARQGCTEAIELSHKLLRFSGHEVVATAPLDLVHVLTDMRPTIADVVGPRIAVTLRITCPSAPLRANRARIHYILMQLALNARDAMPAGGQLDLGLACEAGRILLTVTDDGHGMPPEVKAKVFEPFITTKPRVRGTGLGIPTVYGIVKQLKGSIEIESEVGRGTTVRIEVPAAGPEAATAG